MMRQSVVLAIAAVLILPLILFTNTTSFSYISGNLSSFPSVKLDASLGKNSVIFSQLPRLEHQNLFLARGLNADGVTFSLILAKKTGDSFFKQKTVFNTSGGSVRIHDGQYSIIAAYDPNVVWYRGRYWVAFECWSTEFTKEIPEPTASACMGPLNEQTLELVPEQTYVMVLGGRAPGDANNPYSYSASVPKLLEDQNKLYLYWSSVKIDVKKTEKYYARIRSEADYNSYLLQKMDVAVYNNYVMFKEKVGSFYTGDSPVFLTYERALELKIINTNTSPAAFYDWQKNTLNTVEGYMSWGFSYSDINNSIVSGIAPRSPVEYQFESIETFSASINFSESTSEIYPYIDFAHGQTKRLAYAWQKEHFKTILPVQSQVGFETVADVFDVKKIGNEYYFTAALGGSYNDSSDPDNEYKKRLSCLTPVIGHSAIGCYRLAVFKSTRPQSMLSSANLVSMNLNYDYLPTDGYSFRAAPGHEYSKFIRDPSTKQTSILVKFIGKKELVQIPFAIGSINFYKYTTDTLYPGQSLKLFNGLISKNKKYILQIFKNGFEIRSTETSKVIKKVELPQSGSKPVLSLQSDGHLVYYSNEGSTQGIWATYKLLKNSRLILQDDGNLVQYGEHNEVVWHSMGFL